jgi:hypothetical protein
MWAWGAMSVMAGMIDGMASTLSGGVVGGLFFWILDGRFVC